jgi:hypothetical protein
MAIWKCEKVFPILPHAIPYGPHISKPILPVGLEIEVDDPTGYLMFGIKLWSSWHGFRNNEPGFALFDLVSMKSQGYLLSKTSMALSGFQKPVKKSGPRRVNSTLHTVKCSKLML